MQWPQKFVFSTVKFILIETQKNKICALDAIEFVKHHFVPSDSLEFHHAKFTGGLTMHFVRDLGVSYSSNRVSACQYEWWRQLVQCDSFLPDHRLRTSQLSTIPSNSGRRRKMTDEILAHSSINWWPLIQRLRPAVTWNKAAWQNPWNECPLIEHQC